jgi:[histone H3]-lysine27 N-trimethyltransferase EZH2
VNKNDYLGEYTGELVSHKEADKRGKIYDRANSSFLFDLNDQVGPKISISLFLSVIRLSEIKKCQNFKIVVNMMIISILQYVLDAYRKGDKLKFANHSSSPNCYAKVVFSGLL